MSAAPLVVVRSAAEAADKAAKLRAAGFRLVEDFDLPAHPWHLGEQRLVCVGELRSAADVPAAVLAAARGAGVVVFGGTDDAVARLSDDLRRVGEFSLGSSWDPLDLLDGEQRRLLELLAEGHSVRAAAAACFLAPRTATRRLAVARAALGAASNAELVVLFARLRLAQSED